jgi:hypothetical protein
MPSHNGAFAVAGMGGLSFLIYPWGFIIQGIALWYFVKLRPENYWLFGIVFGGVLGAGVYMIVEVIPDLGLLRGALQGFGKRSRIRALEIQILDNPSAGNLEELAELNFEQKNYRKALEALEPGDIVAHRFAPRVLSESEIFVGDGQVRGSPTRLGICSSKRSKI